MFDIAKVETNLAVGIVCITAFRLITCKSFWLRLSSCTTTLQSGRGPSINHGGVGKAVDSNEVAAVYSIFPLF